jgi:hypothetical protein
VGEVARQHRSEATRNDQHSTNGPDHSADAWKSYGIYPTLLWQFFAVASPFWSLLSLLAIGVQPLVVDIRSVAENPRDRRPDLISCGIRGATLHIIASLRP